MKNLLIFSDLHISKNSLAECHGILMELLELKNKYEIDHIFNLGDTFDNTKPSSPELDLYSGFIMNSYIPMTLLAANSHESETTTDSVVNHFAILNGLVEVVKEWQDEYMYLGHFCVNESNKGYGATKSLIELKQYKHIYLGHQHLRQDPFHIGSCRYVSFDEAIQEKKYVVVIQNYTQSNEKTLYIALQSPYPMYQLSCAFEREKVAGSPESVKNLTQIEGTLDSLTSNAKVKIQVYDFKGFTELLKIEKKFRDKFTTFLIEPKFATPTIETIAPKEVISLKDSLIEFLTRKQSDQRVIQAIKDEIK